MKQIKKKILYFLLSACLLLSSFSCFVSAAADEENYKYIITDNEITITKYIGTQNEVTVPSTIDGVPVTEIGETAFQSCEQLVRLTIPDSVQEIGQGAFANCSRLTDVTLPNGITSLANYLFAGCTNLCNVMIPYSVTHIEDYAFAYCHHLNRDILPDSITTLGAFVFSFCEGVNITLPATITNLDDHALYSATWDTSSNTGIPIIGGVFQPTPNRNLTLWVSPDTAAWRYAQKYDIPFIAIMEYNTNTLGDINGDRSIDALDALFALQHSVRLVALKGSSLTMADVDQNGLIDATDALKILQHSVAF